SEKAECTICAVGVCLFEALAAAEELQKEGILISVIDTYSIKPLDEETILRLAAKSKRVVTVEDHYLEGGLGEAINSALIGKDIKVTNLAVRKLPKSGSVEKLMEFTEIDKAAIIKTVKQIIKN
ncbi:MAG: transketolase C-terminal domain-containing protein, partial [Patescibacteria group bacterium]